MHEMELSPQLSVVQAYPNLLTQSVLQLGITEAYGLGGQGGGFGSGAGQGGAVLQPSASVGPAPGRGEGGGEGDAGGTQLDGILHRGCPASQDVHGRSPPRRQPVDQGQPPS